MITKVSTELEVFYPFINVILSDCCSYAVCNLHIIIIEPKQLSCVFLFFFLQKVDFFLFSYDYDTQITHIV